MYVYLKFKANDLKGFSYAKNQSTVLKQLSHTIHSNVQIKCCYAYRVYIEKLLTQN